MKMEYFITYYHIHNILHYVEIVQKKKKVILQFWFKRIILEITACVSAGR